MISSKEEIELIAEREAALMSLTYSVTEEGIRRWIKIIHNADKKLDKIRGEHK
jgi:hypothetical protein